MTPEAPSMAEPGGVLRADLAVGLASRQARAAIRQALAAWGMDDPSGDAELLASELVANAAEHTGSQQIGFVLRQHTERDGQRGVTCEVTDASPALPRPRRPAPVMSEAGARPSSPPLPPLVASGPRRAARQPGSPSPCPAARPLPCPAARRQPGREPEAGA